MEPRSDRHSSAEPAWPVLDRYLAGAASDAERREIESWLGADPWERAEIAVLASVLREGSDDAFTTQSPPLASRPERRALRHGTSDNRWSRLWVTPVVALVFVGAGLASFVARRHSADSESSSSARRYTTRAGQQATVTLASGARAHLAPATTLTTRTTADDISVTIDGAALFTVTPDQRAPFIVHSARAEVRVLGTRFLVRQYPGEPVARVAVVDGRVAVHASPSSRASSTHARDGILTAGMTATVSDSGLGVTAPSSSITDQYTAWTRGRLVFRDAPVRDIIAELGRTYDVDIRLADSAAATRKLTWTVPISSRSIDDVLVVLTDLLGAHSTRHGRAVTIVPGRRDLRKLVQPVPTFTTESQYGR
jgi:transmembrane sensor